MKLAELDVGTRFRFVGLPGSFLLVRKGLNPLVRPTGSVHRSFRVQEATGEREVAFDVPLRPFVVSSLAAVELEHEELGA